MNLNLFKLEEYLAQYEFSAPYLLCCSDAQSWTMQEIVNLANHEHTQLWNKLSLGYTEIKGLPILRKQIAQSLYPSLKADNIVTFAGAEEGIFCALSTLCQPGDHVIALTPCYQSLIEIPKAQGCDITAVALQESNNWKIDIDAIKKAIKSSTKVIIINFPHNPTGQIITQEELEELVKLCDHHGIWIFSDEVYHLLGLTTKWSSPAAEIYPKALSLGVMSKAFGLAGLRIGWLACQDTDLLKKIERIKHYTSICNSAPSEILTLIALDNKETLLARNNDIIKNNIILLDNFFKEYEDRFSWVRPNGGCIGFPLYKGKESIEIFCDQLVKKSGVLLIPGSIYDVSTNHFRIGFGRKNMPEALNRLKQFLDI
jgi:aspartate/methionine/tyrosine aminotransferase